MSDVETVRRMLSQVSFFELHGQELVYSLPIATLAEDFNGIGPEWFPEQLRKAIDRMHSDFLPVAFVHDVMWSHSDGSISGFDHSNDCFLINGYKVARKKYGWYDPRRYWRMRQARMFAELCQVFGMSAYLTAYHKQKNRKEN